MQYFGSVATIVVAVAALCMPNTALRAFDDAIYPVYLQRANPIHSHRHRDLSGGRRRPPDADDGEPAAAGPEIFHSTEEVTTQKLRPSKSMRSDFAGP
jgi:hypothetical protein